MNIRINIERLVLHGLPLAANQGPQVKAAVQSELSRLLVADGLATDLRTGGDLKGVPAPTFRMERVASPRSLGRQIARSVYRGIGK
jgi:hypothetical protein